MTTRSAKKTFRQACLRSATRIREGGLKVEGQFAQVHESAFTLAKINEMGLLTYSSQDAVDWRTGKTKPEERPYIIGLMLPEEAETFTDLVNLNSDKVAFWQAPTENQEKKSVIALSMRASGCRGYSANVNYPLSMADIINRESGLRKNFSAVRVTVFDPTWGRPAVSADRLFDVVIKALDATTYEERLAIHRAKYPPKL